MSKRAGRRGFILSLGILIAGAVLAAEGARAAGDAAGAPGTASRPRRIALVSDPHVSTKPTERQYAEHFKAVIGEVNEAGVDAVVLAGDLTQDGSPGQMAAFKSLLGEFKAPTVMVAGNHDVGNKRMAQQKTSLGPNRLANFQQNIGPLWYAKELAPGLRIVGICSSLLGSGLPEEDEQWAFLGHNLRSEQEGATTMLLTHYPPYITRPDEADEYFNISKGPRERLLAALGEAGVQTILSGHLHRPIEWRSAEGIHLIGAPAVSFGLPHGRQREGWVLVTVNPDGTSVRELKYLPPDASTTTRAAP